MTFLSVYTPTYRRPRLLEQCRRSVAMQTRPVEHVIINDHVGLGVDGMFRAIPNHAEDVSGEYVMVLSDDNVLAADDFAARLEVEAATYEHPAVIVFKGEIEGNIQPAAWKCEPEETKIDLSCFAVTRDVWIAYSGAWGNRYEGDFDFIHTLWNEGLWFHWFDTLAFRALQVSHGKPEGVPA